MGVVTQCLIYFEVHSASESPCPILLGWPETGGWIAQNPRVEKTKHDWSFKNMSMK